MNCNKVYLILFGIICQINIFGQPILEYKALYRPLLLEADYPLISNTTYGPITEMQITHIASDYGPRNHTGTFWHRGMDCSSKPGAGDLGYALNAIEAGNVFEIFSHTSGATWPTRYKGITISGENIFFYGHIFDDEDYLTNWQGIRCGNFTFTKLQNYNDLVIVYFIPPVLGWGDPDIVVLCRRFYPDAIVNYQYIDDNGDVQQSSITTYTTTFVEYLQEIGPIGGSGGSSGKEHLHLGRLKSEMNYSNDKTSFRSPLEILTYNEPDYTDMVTVYQPELVYGGGGNANSSVRVRCEMKNPGADPTNQNYSNCVNNIDRVDLYLKQDFEDDITWQHYQGRYYTSYISLGGRDGTSIYPLGVCEGKVNDTGGVNTAFGDTEKTGVHPYAYDSGQGPYDDYYFSDLYIRRSIADKDIDATHISEAKYPEGKYHIKTKITTVKNVEYEQIFQNFVDGTNSVPFIVDNFLPYIEKVELKELGEDNCEYEYSRIYASGSYSFSSLENYFNSNIDVQINVSISEPLNELRMQLINETGAIDFDITNRASLNQENKNWTFYIPANKLSEGKNKLKFLGKDYGDNELLKDKEPSTTPIRTETGWSVDISSMTGADDNYNLHIVPVSSDNLQMQLVNNCLEGNTARFVNSTENNCTIDFGDGVISTISSNTLIEHSYEESGPFTVKMTRGSEVIDARIVNFSN